MSSESLSHPGGFIHIHRIKSVAAGLRKIEIWIDGEKVGFVKNGENMNIPVPPGAHKLVAKMFPKFNSDEIAVTVGKNETKYFELSTAKMNCEIITRVRHVWLWFIPLAFLREAVRAHLISPVLYTPIYWGYCLAIICFVLLKVGKKGSGQLFKGMYFSPVQSGEEVETNKWEFRSLVNLEILAIYCIVLPLITRTLYSHHVPGPWMWFLSRDWYSLTTALFCVGGYALTSVLFNNMIHRPEKNMEAVSGNLKA